jgi:hypothetical protein
MATLLRSSDARARRNPQAVFSRLGDEVEARWKKAAYASPAFPEIATTALRASDVFTTVLLEDVARWFVSSPDLPAQIGHPFGQPPLNVYKTEKFYIELLFWIDSPTSIHQHAFSGAFGVLRGSSYHSCYGFQTEEQITNELRIGRLDFRFAELLRQGDVRTIEPGERFIHALLHLEPPSISVVVRTVREPEFAPQYSYLAPGLARDPFYKPQPLAARLDLLKMLYKTDVELFKELAQEHVATAGLWDAYAVASLTARLGIDSAAFASVLAPLEQRHPRLARFAAMGFRERHREFVVQNYMRKVRDRDLRLFFAMLINAPDRQVIYDLTRTSFPNRNPHEKILQWIDELAKAGTLHFQFEHPSLLLHYAIRGASFAEMADAVRQRLHLEERGIAALRRDWYSLHCVELLQPLLRGPAQAGHATGRQPPAG